MYKNNLNYNVKQNNKESKEHSTSTTSGLYSVEAAVDGTNIGNSANTVSGINSDIYVNLGGIGLKEENSSNAYNNSVYKKIDIGINTGLEAETVKWGYGEVILSNINEAECGLPAKIGPWTKIKNFLSKQITITPYQKKVLGEVRDFWCKDIFNIFTRNKNNEIDKKGT